MGLPRLFVLIALSVTFFIAAAQLIPGATPQFEPLFVGTLLIGENDVLDSPLGTRIHIPASGGSLLDMEGNLVGMFHPGFDTGVVTSDGIFYPDAVFPFVWTADQKNAYLRATGVGKVFDSVLLYVHLETDSNAYKSLNSRFLLANVSYPNGQGSNPTFTIYGAV